MDQEPLKPDMPAVELATFGAGCFWCVEAVFQQLVGVVSVEPGYAGGLADGPTYEQVCNGGTGHAEVCQIRFDPRKISYRELLEVFWKTHDPTTQDRQGNDLGNQYRSVIFYHDEQQQVLAEESKRELDASGVWHRPVVTQVRPLTRFHPAEEYHHDYFHQHPSQEYCALVIRPKVEKFRKVFASRLKTPQ